MNCPKCGNPIKWHELSPNCKKCGVHIMYYTQERDLARDAKRAELEFAKGRILVSKLKDNFIGGKLPIARLVIMLLCVGALCIPFFDIKAALPFSEIKLSVGGIGIYSMINDSLYTHLFDLLNAGVAEGAALKAFIGLVLFALTVLAVLAVLIVYIISFLNKHKYAKVLCIITGIAAVLDAAAAVWGFTVKSAAKDYGFITVKSGFGGFVALLVFAAFFVCNYLIYKQNTPYPVKEVDLQRVEVFKKLKAGEINIDDLTLPIFETEEEREARKNALAGKKKEKKKKRGKKAKEEKTDE